MCLAFTGFKSHLNIITGQAAAVKGKNLLHAFLYLIKSNWPLLKCSYCADTTACIQILIFLVGKWILWLTANSDEYFYLGPKLTEVYYITLCCTRRGDPKCTLQEENYFEQASVQIKISDLVDLYYFLQHLQICSLNIHAFLCMVQEQPVTLAQSGSNSSYFNIYLHLLLSLLS